MTNELNVLASDLEKVLTSEFLLKSYHLNKEDVSIQKSDEYVEFSFEASCEPTLSMTEELAEMIASRLKKKANVVSDKRMIGGVVYL